MNSKQVPSAGRMTFTDGHELNESYKKPSTHPSGRENSSYMHPHVEKLSLEKPWSSVDKSLAEAGRPQEQLSRSKTVFPVSSGKTRGTPTPPAYAKATRGPSHSPSPAAIPGAVKPVIS